MISLFLKKVSYSGLRLVVGHYRSQKSELCTCLRKLGNTALASVERVPVWASESSESSGLGNRFWEKLGLRIVGLTSAIYRQIGKCLKLQS